MTTFRYHCHQCGQSHEGLPDLAFDAPLYYHALKEAERGRSAWLTSDFCQVGQDFFIRGSLEIPILDHDQRFSYGVWLSLSEKNFRRYQELFELDQPPPERYVGWISNRIPGYPDTLKLKGAATLRPHNLRPVIELEPTDHPLAVAQREGLPVDRIAEICSAVLHNLTDHDGQ